MIKDSLKKKYTCPHCFAKFTKLQALFRCQSIPEVCDYEVDAIYDHHHPDRQQGAQGRLFEPQSQDLLKKLNDHEGQKCDLCAHITDQRACPQCHHNLEKGFFLTDYIHIGVVGLMAPQLAHYVAMARKIFSDNAAHNLDFQVHPTTNQDLEIKFERLERQSYAIYQTLVFHRVNMEEGAINFDHYDAILYALPIPTLPLKYNAFEDLMKVVHHAMPAGKQKINKPFMIVYHSFEKLVQLLPETHILLQQSQHIGGYDHKDGDQISGEMMAYTGAWYGSNTLHFIKRQLPFFRFFAMSLSYPNDQVAGEGSGWRLIDPLTWLLAQKDMVRKKP